MDSILFGLAVLGVASVCVTVIPVILAQVVGWLLDSRMDPHVTEQVFYLAWLLASVSWIAGWVHYWLS